jgi:hypothetical protein
MHVYDVILLLFIGKVFMKDSQFTWIYTVEYNSFLF